MSTIAAKGLSAVTARDIMTTEVVTIPDTVSAREAVSLLVSREISGAPVVNDDGDLVGVVSLADIARSVSDQGQVGRSGADPGFYLVGRVEDVELAGWEESYDMEDIEYFRVKGDGGASVGDLMTPTVITVAEDASVAEIAGLMVSGHYHRILVASNGGLAGIVTSMDLIELLAEAE